jgi:hypothetical protein
VPVGRDETLVIERRSAARGHRVLSRRPGTPPDLGARRLAADTFDGPRRLRRASLVVADARALVIANWRPVVGFDGPGAI